MNEAAFGTARSGTTRTSAHEVRHPSAWARWTVFASTLMVLTGCFTLIQGLVAVLDDDFYLVTDSGLVVDADYTLWGWTYILTGVVIVAASVALLWGQAWARVVGVVLAGANALLNFAFIAAYPAWSIIVITIDVFIILALTVHSREAMEA